MIEVTGLKKRYGSFEAVRGVSFSLGEGGILGLLGPNGAGKTTIMKVLTGYHLPSEGRAVLDGIDVAEDPLGVKSRVGYLPEGVPLYLDMCVGEYLGFVGEARGIPRAGLKAAVARSMDACGLGGMSDMRMEHLSKGFRQRVGLAQAIVHDPPILILDEPTTGLDPNQILEIRTLIRSLGSRKTVILSTHILQEVEALCSRVIILNEGLIAAQGSPAEIADSLKGEERLECILSGAGPGALASIRDEPLLGAAEAVDAGGGRTRYSAKVPAGHGDEAAAALFRWAVASGGVILELRRERLSLEEIFVKLTGEEARP